MEEKIKELTKLVAQLSKLTAEVVKFLAQLTLAEMAVKTIIQIWTNL